MQNQKIRVALLLLVALLVRLLGIASRPIWYDEAFSILFSEKGIEAMLYGTLAPTGAGSADIHPLGYYTILWLWMRVFGESLIATRALSILAGLVSVYLVYRVSLELFSEKTAQFALLISALSPFQIHYAQEIRMYAFLSMWLLLATFACLRGAKTGNWGWWLMFAVASTLAQYTHNLAAFYLIPLAMIPVIKRDWKALRATILAGFFALFLYIPWLIQLPAQFATIQQGYWVDKPDIVDIFNLSIVYITNTPLPDQWIAFALLISLLIVVVGMMQTIRAFRANTLGNGGWALYLAFVPFVFLFLFSQWKPVYIERALLPSGAMFCAWLAWMITNTNMAKGIRTLMITMLAIAFTIGLYEHITYRDFPYGPFRKLDKSLKDRYEANDVIIHSTKMTMLPAMLFDRELSQSFIADAPGSRADTLAPATQQVLGIEAETDIRSASRNANRIWYIIFQQSNEEYKDNGQPAHPDIEYLNSQYTLVSQENWDGLQLLLYIQIP